MQRRDFLKVSAALGGSATLVGCGSDQKYVPPAPPEEVPEKVDWSYCTNNCGRNCPLRVYSRNGVITRVEPDDENRACARGRAAKLRVDAKERIKYPMRRIGKRGEGKFERISWDEAISLIASKVAQVQRDHGPEALHALSGMGSINDGAASNLDWTNRWMACSGGFLNWHSTYSFGQANSALHHMYGGWQVTTTDQISKSDFVLAFGVNPSETSAGGGAAHNWALESEKAPEIIQIGPRYTDSMLGKESQWMPVRPGTDAALVEAIAYILIRDGNIDEDFLNKYCIGYDSTTLPDSAPSNGDYKSHILGLGDDGVAKTPEWAEKITGVSVAQIEYVAKRLAEAERPFVVQGGGIQRQGNGEFSCRAIMLLPFLVGAVGREGTNAGGISYGMFDMKQARPIVPAFPYLLAGLQKPNPQPMTIHCAMFHEAIRLKDGGFSVKEHGLRRQGSIDIDPADEDRELSTGIKFIYGQATNSLINQHPGCHRNAEIVADESLCEMIVLHEVFMTASAKYADILLPGTMDMEQQDINTVMGDAEVLKMIATTTSIRPAFEAKTAFEVGLLISRALGVEQEYTEGRTYDEWEKALWETGRRNYPQLPTYETMREVGLWSTPNPISIVALKSFIDDPVNNPVRTPSGKVEIYSERYAHKNNTWKLPDNEWIPALPIHVAMEEGYEDEELRKTYPFQWISFKSKRSVHSSSTNNPWLEEAIQDVLWMNPVDANEKGLKNGDKVKVSSPRGSIVKTLRVTPRIAMGVLAQGNGSWYQPDENGLDLGGCPNTLVSEKPSPCDKNMRASAALVDVEKYI